MTKRSIIINELKQRILKKPDFERELKRYRSEFRREPDYAYAQHCHLIISFCEVRALYCSAGYKTSNYTDEQLWKMYLHATGDAIDEILSANSGQLKHKKS